MTISPFNKLLDDHFPGEGSFRIEAKFVVPCPMLT